MNPSLRLHPQRVAGWGPAVTALVAHGVASRIAAQDAAVWGPAAEAEASIRLGWTRDPRESLSLVDEIIQLRQQLQAAGATEVVLCGMGGSSLAPEVMAKSDSVPLEVLDSTHPDQVARALAHNPSECIVVVSSKSGGTVETAAARAVWEKTLRDGGISPQERIIVVTDPGSPLEREAQRSGYRVFAANPEVGGRFSALTAFGLVPSTLAGVDTKALLQEASEWFPVLREDRDDNPAVLLAAALSTERDIAVLLPDSHSPGLGDWIEQLVAESTGKDGRGVLPVVASSRGPAEVQAGLDDVVVIDLGGGDPLETGADVSISAPLGAQFLLWEYATAMLGYLLQLNPFDQPDVESAKVAARSMLDQPVETRGPAVSDEGIEIWAPEGFAADIGGLAQIWRSFLDALGPSGYLAVCLYVDRGTDADVASFRDDLARRLGRPVTVGFGPRFLHSTGQFHKGGVPDGIFLQIEQHAQSSVDIPGFPFDFGRLIDAQSAGDRAVLSQRGRPVLTLRIGPEDSVQSLLNALGASA